MSNKKSVVIPSAMPILQYKNGNSQESTEKFQKISEAFSILSDPNERVKYDANRNNPFANIGGNAGMGGGGGIRINPMDIFNMFMLKLKA